MKVIVVSGARSNVGKTQLARALCELLPGAVRIKIGHHVSKPGGDDNLYQMGTSFSTIESEHRNAHFLIIESNRILKRSPLNVRFTLLQLNRNPRLKWP